VDILDAVFVNVQLSLEKKVRLMTMMISALYGLSWIEKNLREIIKQSSIASFQFVLRRQD
jgi:hypothetical protein